MEQEEQEQLLEEEGRRIAHRLGQAVTYTEPSYGTKGEFVGYFFQDKVTGSSFVAKTFEDAKAGLIKMRKEFGTKSPLYRI